MLRQGLFFAICLLTARSAYAQSVGGRVVDRNSQPVYGVTIRSSDRSVFTVSQADGTFEIQNGGSKKLTFRHLAFKTIDTTLTSGVRHLIILDPATLESAGVVVTATRSERDAEQVAVPVSVVSGADIETSGQTRLSGILAEQTGLQLVANFGTGLQLQGFDADYTLIMIDGEPLIGRTAGTLDLRRIPVANIKRIETVKGPSSALWGSDALAGVVNIITETPGKGMHGGFDLRYGSFNTLDGALQLTGRTRNQDFSAFLNTNRTNGYDLDSASAGLTAPSFHNYTSQIKYSVQFNEQTRLTIQSRLFSEELDDSGILGANDETASATGNRQQTSEWSINPVLKTRFRPGLIGTLRFYHTAYSNEFTNLETDSESDGLSMFEQKYTKSEIQLDYSPSASHWFTAGSGFFRESVQATRYLEKPAFQSLFVYGQHEWIVSPALNLTYGARFDRHSEYKPQLSPKISALFTPNASSSVRASLGRGFKAPDFRQLLLGFTNAVAGYSIFGSSGIAEALAGFDARGEIQTYLVDPASLQNIRAEQSWAFNTGFDHSFSQNLSIRTNVFYNLVNDLIDTRAVALKTNGSNIFTYVNLNRVVTRGVEAELRWQINTTFRASAGYQFLDARDRDVVQRLRDGQVFRQGSGFGQVERVQLSDYGGLFNRSRHMTNLSLTYGSQTGKNTATLRAQFRSRYGLGDLNGNEILDAANEYAPAYALLNTNVRRQIAKNFHLMAGIDNLLNHTNPSNQPFLAGRIYYASINLQF